MSSYKRLQPLGNSSSRRTTMQHAKLGAKVLFTIPTGRLLAELYRRDVPFEVQPSFAPTPIL